MEENSTHIGTHYLIELLDCDSEALKFLENVEPVLIEAAKISGATYLSHVSHQFEPFGVTSLVLVAESHFSIHTWPEKNFAAVDIFTCGEMNIEPALELLKSKFGANCKTKIVVRKTI